jgi:hypothetical protein
MMMRMGGVGNERNSVAVGCGSCALDEEQKSE